MAENTTIYAQRALQLIEHGYTPIPLDGKRPILDGWQNLRHVTPQQIRQWDDAGYFKNLGIVCGEASSNLVVMDFDGLAGYELFKARFPELLDTLTIATGSGEGVHCYYRVELLPDSRPVKGIIVPETGELVNIEVRADGLQVVAPPSIHPDTHKPYEVMKRLNVKKVLDFSEVVAWVKSLKPETEWQAPANYTRSGDDPLNPKLLAAVEAHFMAQPHKIHRSWINCSCPNTSAHKHGDKDFSFGYNPEFGAGYCFVCEGMNLKELCSYIGIDPKAYGGIYEHSEPLNIRQAMPMAAPLAIVQLPEGLPVVKRSDRLSTFQDRLYDYETPREIIPVVSPLKAIHPLGGMARVLKPGKLVGIIGPSGGGKTSLMESMVDSWLDYDVPSLVWSPEWDADEFIERAVQRYGGASVEDLYLHDIFIHEVQTGQPHRAGVELSQEQLTNSSKALAKLRSWKTEVGYLDMPFLTIAALRSSIDATLAKLDFKPRVLVIDYAQLMLAVEPDAKLTMYNLLMQIKAVCKSFNLVGVVASQITKNSAKGQADGKVLDSLDARYVNDDAFNLFVTINPERDEKGAFVPTAILNVAKNSMGKKGKVRVGVAWDKLAFETFRHPNQFIEEDEE